MGRGAPVTGNGFGSFSAVIDGNKVCYGLTVANIGKPMAAHIHRGARNANGDVVFTLKHPKAGDPGASSQCTNIAGSDWRTTYATTQGQFYVNVHNDEVPVGAMSRPDCN